MEINTKDKKASLSSQFQGQLTELMKQLYCTDPHYIRCIKPNHDKASLKFVPRNCFEQLTYSGVFEAVAIRKQGFPFRLPHAQFVERYGKLCKDKSLNGGDVRSTCQKIVSHMKLDMSNVQLGKSRVLYRALEYRNLELQWSIVTKNENIHKNLDRLTSVDSSGMGSDEKNAYIIELADAVREADLFRIKTAVAEKGKIQI